MARSRQYPPSVDPGRPVEPKLPHGWNRCTFGDVIDVVKRPVMLDPAREYQRVVAKRNRGGIVSRGKVRGDEILTPTQFEVRGGDFLISRRQIIHGACGIVPPDLSGAVVSNEYATLRPKSQLRISFLAYLSHTPYFQRACFHSSHGVDVEKMIFNLDEWLKFHFLLPPLPEQQKIAAILSSVDDAIEKTQAVINQVQVVKKGLTQELLTRGLPGRHTRFKKTEIGEVPQEWEVVPVGLVFSVQLGKMLSKTARTGKHPKPYLRNANVQWNRIVLDEVLLMDFDEAEMQKYRLQAGDLLVCEGGEVGRAAIWTGESRECYYQKALHRLRPIDGRLLNEFMLSYLELKFRHEKAFSGERGQTTIAHLPRERLEKLPMPVPVRWEQEGIARVLAAIDAESAALNSSLQAHLSLKQALMHVLLTGEIRVKPDAEAA